MYAEYFINGFPALSDNAQICYIDKIPSVGQIISPFIQSYTYRVKKIGGKYQMAIGLQIIDVTQIDLEPADDASRQIFERQFLNKK